MSTGLDQTYADYHKHRLAGRQSLVLATGAGAYLMFVLATPTHRWSLGLHLLTLLTFLATGQFLRRSQLAIPGVIALSLTTAGAMLLLDAEFGATNPEWVVFSIIGLSALTPLPSPAREVQTSAWLTLTLLHALVVKPLGSPNHTAVLVAAVGLGWVVSWANVSAWRRSFENVEVQRQMSDRLAIARDALEGAVKQTRDELAEQQNRLVQNERLATLGRLAAGIAHEINNPLAVALTNLDLAITEYDPSLLDDARASLRRIRNIVSDLTRVARPGDIDHVEAIPLETVITYASDVVRVVVKGRLKIIMDIPPGVRVLANRGRLEQVMVNLLMNAWQATAEAGDGRVVLTTERLPSAVALRFDDNGPGIPDDIFKDIFEPFFTTKPVGEGSGLGLAISRSYMQAMGGSLAAQRKSPLGGARLILTIPLPDPNAEAPTPKRVADDADPPTPVRESHATPHILVIDDEPALRRSLTRALQKRWIVHCAAHSEEAAAIFTREPIDVVLCDLILAKEAGIDVIRRLATDRPEILRHTLLMTGEPGSHQRADILRRNQPFVVQKPFDLADLDTRLSEARLGHRTALALETTVPPSDVRRYSPAG